MATTELAEETEQPTRRRFTVDEYLKLAEVGILAEDDRVELLEGEVVEMSPIGSRHAAYVDRLDESVHDQLPRSASIVRVPGPVQFGEYGHLQPDLAVLRFRDDYYAQSHPGPADVLLLVEVADSSLEYDRNVKLPLYSRSGVPEAWLVDIPAGAVERHTEPSEEGYGRMVRVRGERSLESTTLPDLVLNVGELLG